MSAVTETKLLVFIPRRADLNAGTFHEHWRTTHAQLALRIRSLHGYVQSHAIETVPDTFPPAPFARAPFDGVSHAWLESSAATDDMGGSTDYVDGARTDEANFMDVGAKCNLITTAGRLRRDREYRPDSVTTLLLLRRPAETPHERFVGAWTDRERWAAATTDRPVEDVMWHEPVPARYTNRRKAPFDLVIQLWWEPSADWPAEIKRLTGEVDPDLVGAGSAALAAHDEQFL